MKYLLSFFFLVFVNLAHAQKVTTNKKYQFREISTVSFTPYFESNSGFNKMIEETLSSFFSVCCQKEIEHNLMNHETFNQVARRTIYADLVEVIKKKSNLFGSLTDGEKLELQKGCKNTDLIFIFSTINIRTLTKLNSSASISVSSNLTVFDLRTGEFIAFATDHVKKKFDDMSRATPPTKEMINSLITGLIEALKLH